MSRGSLGFPAMQTEAIREANVRYHDLAASHYDSKWGISYGEVGRAQVLGKLRKALGSDMRFGRSLEIGAGTGYFTLNLLKAGVVDRAVATDISPGMLVRPRARPRSPPPPAGPRSGVRRVPARAPAGGPAGLLRRAVSLRRPA